MGADFPVLGREPARPHVLGLHQMGVEIDDGRDAGDQLVADVGAGAKVHGHPDIIYDLLGWTREEPSLPGSGL